MTKANTMTDAAATKAIAKLTAKLARAGRKDLADLLIAAAQTKLAR
jgi:predicted nucleic acid-binding protein